MYLAVRELQPERVDGREAVGLLAVRHLRLLAHAGRLRRRPGGIRARAVRRRRPDQGARQPRPTSRCCSSPTSSRPATWPPTCAASSPATSIAVWGCGPVGQFAIKSAYLLGAERVIAIDRFEYRLRMARDRAGAETINYEEVDVHEALREMTGGRGPDSLHRRGRHGRPCAGPARRVRPGQDDA